MGDRTQRLRARYLDLLEASIQNAIYGEDAFATALNRWALRLRHPFLARRGNLGWPVRAHSMIGPKRLRNLRELTEQTLHEEVPGDYIETGVWRGGACILMRGVLAAYDVTDRRVYCADTFAGLPRPDPAYPADRRDRLHVFSALAVSEEEVRRNFAAYSLLDEQVCLLKGEFKDTLPALPAPRLALMRLDGDMYRSTMDALVHLYDKLSAGGFVIVDDYGGLKNCRKAVHDFLERRNLRPEIERVDESCVFWRKAE